MCTGDGHHGAAGRDLCTGPFEAQPQVRDRDGVPQPGPAGAYATARWSKLFCSCNCVQWQSCLHAKVSAMHDPHQHLLSSVQISDVKSADLLGKRMRLQGADNPDFTIDKAALPPARSCLQHGNSLATSCAIMKSRADSSDEALLSALQVPARPEAGAAAAVQLPRPPPPEGDQRAGGTPLPQESVQLPGDWFVSAVTSDCSSKASCCAVQDLSQRFLPEQLRID
jgi:hypothetical protein